MLVRFIAMLVVALGLGTGPLQCYLDCSAANYASHEPCLLDAHDGSGAHCPAVGDLTEIDPALLEVGLPASADERPDGSQFCSHSSQDGQAGLITFQMTMAPDGPVSLAPARLSVALTNYLAPAENLNSPPERPPSILF